jgi:hypothetical protein
VRDEGFAVFIETIRNFSHILTPFLHQTTLRRQRHDASGKTSHMIRYFRQLGVGRIYRY